MTPRLLAIDPGPELSAWVDYDTATHRPIDFGKQPNALLLDSIEQGPANASSEYACAIEMVASYGMPVGREVFETVLWVGEFKHAYEWAHGQHIRLVYRKDVKLHLCHSPRANDATIRQALIDRYGPGKEKAIGRKATPGPLYGVSGDVWSALAVAVTVTDTTQARMAA